MDVRELLRHMRMTESDRAVARATGAHRKTVLRYRHWAQAHHLLEGVLPPIEDLQALLVQTGIPSPPPQMVSTLEPYRDLVTRLHEDGVEGAAIWQRLRERGYDGSVSAVYRFVHRLSPPQPDATVRVEREPGEEAQVDFGFGGRMADPETGALRRTWVFVMTLSWSRYQYAEFVFDQTIATWLRLHRNALEHFGGVPRRLVIDNLKAGITQASWWDDALVQASYRACAEHYGFLVAPCRPRTPAHKGKVEQGGIHYVKRNFLGGRIPTTLTQANADVVEWCRTTAGQRRHGTTKVPPLWRFETTERAALQSLPATPYDLATWKEVRVQRDCYAVFDGSFYAVPFRAIGQRVRVRGGGRAVTVYGPDDALLATHPRAEQSGERHTHHDHLPPEKLPGLLLNRAACRRTADAIGPATAAVVHDLLADPAVDRGTTVGRVLRLRDRYGDERLEAACARARRFDDQSYSTIKRILIEGLDADAPPTALPAPPAHTFVRSAADLRGHLFGSAS